MYTDTAHKVVVDVLNGFNACLLCYGQTGSGKTYTMFGPDGELARLAALPPTHVVCVGYACVSRLRV